MISSKVIAGGLAVLLFGLLIYFVFISKTEGYYFSDVEQNQFAWELDRVPQYIDSSGYGPGRPVYRQTFVDLTSNNVIDRTQGVVTAVDNMPQFRNAVEAAHARALAVSFHQ